MADLPKDLVGHIEALSGAVEGLKRWHKMMKKMPSPGDGEGLPQGASEGKTTRKTAAAGSGKAEDEQQTAFYGKDE